MPKPKAITRTTPTQQKPQRSAIRSRVQPKPEPKKAYAHEIRECARVTTEKGDEWAIPGDWVVDFPGGRRILVHAVDYFEAEGMFGPDRWLSFTESPAGLPP
jgi:hypothetical protein